MNAIVTVMLKEIRDFTRDRRTMFMALLLGPLVIPVLIVGLSTIVDRKFTQQLEKPLALPVIGAEHAPNLIAWLEGQNVEVSAGPADPEEAIRQQLEPLVLRIQAGYAERWRAGEPAMVEILHDATRQDSRIPVERLSGLLQGYSQTVGALRLLARGISPAVGQPVLVSRVDLSTPEARAGQLMSFLPYFLILSAFLGGAYLVIDITAGERERQSLEPLLATPAAREAIMSGKIAAACVVGLVSLLLILVAFKIGFQIAPGMRDRADVSVLAIARILVILLPMLLIGTTLLTLIASSVKSVKEAQSYMSILMFVPIIPTMYLLISPVRTQDWMYAVPFLAQNQMITNVLRGDHIGPVQWSIYLAAGFGLGLALWLLAARLYHREKLAISA
ncbi:ABC transporter permease [Alkalisalibacterium limincola]|uniref:ABC transporter permease n=1 Tax=Alkalisalibacterium limincola TaxID=2699169 RepID=A0A5C8KLM9_9GAMM|nr:ABC transporter permease [Alkalisalibacterium limincola]TXK60689.1 ABC transporter permease [Alkalisalibacterium limincola]